MKKVFLIVTLAVFVLYMTGCGSKNEPANTTTTNSQNNGGYETTDVSGSTGNSGDNTSNEEGTNPSSSSGTTNRAGGNTGKTSGNNTNTGTNPGGNGSYTGTNQTPNTGINTGSHTGSGSGKNTGSNSNSNNGKNSGNSQTQNPPSYTKPVTTTPVPTVVPNNPDNSNPPKNITDNPDATVILFGNSISIKGSGASVNGNTVRISSAGWYSLAGSLQNGMVEVNTTEKVTLELCGVTINNNNGPAILITNAKKATVNLKAGTNNKLSDGNNNKKTDAALFSNDTLSIEGEGNLVVNGNFSEGISSDDNVTIKGGTIKIYAVDDGINAHDDISIKGGYVYIDSKGDGIDSNGTINISGGTLISLSGITDGNGGLDAGTDMNITGGTIIATGAVLKLPSSASTQKGLFLDYGSVQNGKSTICFKQNGKNIFTFLPGKTYQQIFYSSPAVFSGLSYQVYMGGSGSGTFIDGIYYNGSYSGGSLYATVNSK